MCYTFHQSTKPADIADYDNWLDNVVGLGYEQQCCNQG